MEYHIEKFVSILSNDSALQTLLAGSAANKKIYPVLPDRFESYPCIIYEQISGGFNTVPRNTGSEFFDFKIFVKTDTAPRALVEDIVTRVNDLLNYYVEVSSSERIIYSKQINNSDINDADTRIFGKVLRFEIFFRN